MLKAESLSYELHKKELIHSISLQFSPGILYGILGPNGSGKTTLLKTLTGIWKPSKGKVLFNDQDLHLKSRREISRSLSLVPQNLSVNFDFTVAEVVAMGRYPHENAKPTQEVIELIEWALVTVDAWHLRFRHITHLSSGERHRVYIARSLVTESPVLLLDEPAASLDIRHQLEIWHLLKKLASQGKIIIATNHDLGAVERFCDHIAVLHHGQCIAKGSFQEVITPSLLEEVFGVVEKMNRFELVLPNR